MPQAIGALIFQAAFAIGGTVGVALVTIAPLLVAGIIFGGVLLLKSVFGPKRPKPSDGQQTIRQAAGSRVRNYGIVQTGGTLSFFESRNGTLAQVVTLGTGIESGEIIEHRINDKPVTVSGGTVTDASFLGALHIYTRQGLPAQTAIGELASAGFTEWTANHRQRGCAHAAIIAHPVKQEDFSGVYNGQLPAYTQARKGLVVYDPRLDSTNGGTGAARIADVLTWTWSDNAALVIADYLAHADGCGLGYDAIDWADWAIEANHADETVTTVTSETIARWRLWASYSLTDNERRQVLADMLAACDAFLWQGPDLKLRIRLGRWIEPTVTITDAMILAQAPSFGPEETKRVSAIKMLYTEAAIGYREQESALTPVPGVNADPNTDAQAVQAYYIPHHNQAMRVGKLRAAELGGRWHNPATLNLAGLDLVGERFARYDSMLFGLAFYVRIDKFSFDAARNTIAVELTEVRPEDWDFNAALEEGTPPASNTSTSTATIAAPTGLTLSAVQIAGSSGTSVAIAASWTALRAGLIPQVRYRPTAGGDWLSMPSNGSEANAQSGPVSSGVQYDVQIRSFAILGLSSAWSAIVHITPLAADTLAPPSALAATGGVASADVTFRMPIQSTLAYARLYHGTSSSFGSATQVGGDIVGGLGQVMTIHDTGLAAGTEYYWARAFDGAGGQSTLAGPITATIT